jgi:hypothetical protein
VQDPPTPDGPKGPWTARAKLISVSLLLLLPVLSLLGGAQALANANDSKEAQFDLYTVPLPAAERKRVDKATHPPLRPLEASASSVRAWRGRWRC